MSCALALGCLACSDDGKASGAGGSGGKPSSSGAPSKPPTTSGASLGDTHQGVYHLGPVDFDETQWHNACAPTTKYRSELRESVGLGGEYLAGVSNAFNLGGGVCDACILIETAKGKSIVARVVTYGVEHEDGDIDVSPSVFDELYQNEDPRSQSWHFTPCPDEGGLKYEFQTGSNPYWTSLWVRNPRLPIVKAEVKTAGSKDFVELMRGGDGTLTDAAGFGEGAFSFRLTAMSDDGTSGAVITDDLPGFKPGELVDSDQQF